MSNDINIVKELFDKLESIDKSVDSINVILAVQAEQLKEHIKRSNELEKYVAELEESIEPLKTHVNRVNGLILLLGGIFALIGAIEGILKILNLLNHL